MAQYDIARRHFEMAISDGKPRVLFHVVGQAFTPGGERRSDVVYDEWNYCFAEDYPKMRNNHIQVGRKITSEERR